VEKNSEQVEKQFFTINSSKMEMLRCGCLFSHGKLRLLIFISICYCVLCFLPDSDLIFSGGVYGFVRAFLGPFSDILSTNKHIYTANMLQDMTINIMLIEVTMIYYKEAGTVFHKTQDDNICHLSEAGSELKKKVC